MANSTRYFKTPFANSGARTDLPDESTSGYVALDIGYGADYELAQGDVNRKRIERTTFNQIFYAITENLKQWQENNYPTWIEDDGTGTAFSYGSGVVVTYDSEIWISTESANTDEPNNTSLKWTKYDRASALSVNGTGGALTQTLSELQAAINNINNGIGVNQTWQDVSASRALSTNYTNNTGKPIMVTVYIELGNSGTLTLSVDGVNIGGINPDGSAGGEMSAIVPNGSVYKASGGIDFTRWVELR